MMHRRLFMAVFAAAAFSAHPGSACILPAPFSPEAAAGADAVVVGRIENYRIIVDQKARDDDLQAFFRRGDWHDLRDYFDAPGRHHGDYARFDIAVDETLSGNPARRLTATWKTFPPATPPTGPQLITLHHPPVPKGLRLGWRPELHLPTVLIPSCSEAYVFSARSEAATAVRSAVRNSRPPSLPLNGGRRPEWADLPTRAQMTEFYPAKARRDEIQGSATLDCIALKTGGVTDCAVLSETPRGYGMGEAAVVLFHTHATLKPGSYRPGDIIRTAWRWRLDG